MRDLIIAQVEKYLLFKLTFQQTMQVMKLIDSFNESKKKQN